MSQLPMNYNNSVIYKICCNDVAITDIYVGSTTSFQKRKSQHKCACNNENNRNHKYYVYDFIRGRDGWDNWSMIVEEDFPCDSKNQLHTRERYHVENLHATLNKYIPTRTHQEWYEDNAEHIKEYQKDYYKDNTEHIKQYKQKNAEHFKQYRKENAEHIKARKKPIAVRKYLVYIAIRCSIDRL